MRILAIDDQQLVLLPLEKMFQQLGHEIITSKDPFEGVKMIASFDPDLIIIDLNMPETSGIELIRQIKDNFKHQMPIIVLSGITDDNSIAVCYELGISDYIKKPSSINEIALRIEKIMGGHKKIKLKDQREDILVQERCVGVVIPCYNEEGRLLSKNFLNFIKKNTGYHLCFVNDGSNDNTLQTLKDLQKGREDHITVYDLQKNLGKAEAVRSGMLHLAQRDDLDYIGFLDADLSTDLMDFDELVTTMKKSKFKVVSGSRISRMGAYITKESARKVISLTINFIIQRILRMNFKDTQCGAKIFHKDIINIAFRDRFITKWIFDIEIFKRISLYYGLEKTKDILYEKPLNRWIHADGSKLSMKDSMHIIFQLMKVAWIYRTSSPRTTSYKFKQLKTA